MADRKCRERHKEKPKNIRLTTDMKLVIDYILTSDYRPKQIVGYLCIHTIDCVSIETIYQYIRLNKKAGGD